MNSRLERDVLAMMYSSLYLQMITEIIGAFLIIPLFTYKKDEHKENLLALFISILIAFILLTITSLITLCFLINPMYKLNSIENKNIIIKYLIFRSFT